MGLTITKKPSAAPFYQKNGKRNWNLIREDYVTLKVNGSPMTMREFAKRHHVQLPYLHRLSSDQKWGEIVKQRVEDINNRVTDQLVQRSADAIGLVRQSFATSEAELRERHAKISRDIQGKAITRLNQIPVSKFTAREAIDLLRMGMEQERRALGIPDEQRLHVNGHIAVSREQEIFEQHLLVHQNVQEAVGEALKLLEDKSGASHH